MPPFSALSGLLGRTVAVTPPPPAVPAEPNVSEPPPQQTLVDEFRNLSEAEVKARTEGMTPEERASAGHFLLKDEMEALAKQCGLPPERIAELLPDIGTGKKYDPERIFERYLQLMPFDQLQLRFYEYLLEHPERKAFFADDKSADFRKNFAVTSSSAMGLNLVSMLGFEGLADLLNIKDPAARFGFIMGGIHAVTPLTQNLADGTRAGFRYARGQQLLFAGTEARTIAGVERDVFRVMTRERGLGNALWQIATKGLVPEGAKLLAKIGNGLGNVAAAVAGAPWDPAGGRGILWSRLWGLLFGGDTRVVDGITVPVDGHSWTSMLPFFAEHIADIPTAGAVSRFMASGNWVARLARGAGWVQAIGFGADMTTLFVNWLSWGDRSASYASYAHQVADGFLGSAGSFGDSVRSPLGLLRWAGIGKSFIDATYAGGTIMTPFVDFGDWMRVGLGFQDERTTRTTIAGQVWDQNWIRLDGLATQFKNILTQLVTFGTSDPATFDWQTAIENGYLDRVETPAELATYNPAKDGASSWYRLIHTIDAYRIFDRAAAIADFFDEDFRELDFGSTKYEAGMPVLAEGARDKLFGWLGGEEKILAQRRVNFKKLVIASEIMLNEATVALQRVGMLASAGRSVSAPELAMAQLRHQQATLQVKYWHALAAKADRMEGDQLRADGAYYAALGELTQAVSRDGSPAQHDALKRYAMARVGTLFATTTADVGERRRAASELAVMNPVALWGRHARETRLALEKMRDVGHDGEHCTAYAVDPAAIPALRAAAQASLDHAADLLARDVHSQLAAGHGIGAFYGERDAGIAATTYQLLGNESRLVALDHQIAHLEEIKAQGYSQAYANGDCRYRLVGDACNTQRSVEADLTRLRAERDSVAAAMMRDGTTSNPNFADAARALQDAAGYLAVAPGLADDVAGVGALDSETGLPQDLEAMQRLIRKSLGERLKTEREENELAHKPGWIYTGTPSGYVETQVAQYNHHLKTTHYIFAEWYVEATTSGKDIATYLAEKLQSPAGAAARAHIQDMRTTEEMVWKHLKFSDETYRATNLFDAHGQVTDWSGLLSFMSKSSDGSAAVHRAYLDRVGTEFGEWYADAVAAGNTAGADLESIVGMGDEGPQGPYVMTLVQRLLEFEAQLPTDQRQKMFQRSDDGFASIASYPALDQWLSQRGLPQELRTGDNYARAALVARRDELGKRIREMTLLAEKASDADQPVIRDMLARLAAEKTRYEAGLTTLDADAGKAFAEQLRLTTRPPHRPPSQRDRYYDRHH